MPLTSKSEMNKMAAVIGNVKLAMAFIIIFECKH